MKRLIELWRTPGQRVVLSQEEADDVQSWRDSLNEPGKRLSVKTEYVDRFQRAMVAQALAFDAQSPAGFFLARSQGKLEQLADRVSKAYVIHPLPIYVFYFAKVLHSAAQEDDATEFFREFQLLQSRFAPDDFDASAQKQHNIEEAIAEAAEHAPLA